LTASFADPQWKSGRTASETDEVTIPLGPQGQVIPLPHISAALADSATKGVMVWGMGPLDYVTEEYFVSGLADVLAPVSIVDVYDMSTRNQIEDERPPSYEVRRLSLAQPYCTRIIVSRPRDPARYSGNVVIEFTHPSKGGQPAMWGNMSKYLARGGDMHVVIQHPLTFKAIRAADETRYAPLSVVDLTQGWGMMAQIGALLKTGPLPGELAPFRARRLYQAGYSMTGLAVANFANYHHDATRFEDGSPVFDAYLPLAWNACVRPLDVPVIQVNTQSEITQLPVWGDACRRRPDCDDAIGRYRLYEVAAAPHINLRPKDGAQEPTLTVPFEVDWGGPRLSWTNTVTTFPPGAQPNDLQIHLIVATAVDHIYRWVEEGVAPPPGERMNLDADHRPVLDADGNPTGGLRLPAMDVPTAVRGFGSIDDDHVLFSYMVPFSKAKLKARHGSHDAYVDKIRAASERLVAARLLRPDAVEDVIAQAQRLEAF
jgi:hypothetical protein